VKRVLIVEDSESLSDLMGEILIQNGYEVVGQATKGSESIEIFTDRHPDIVIMDIMLPDMSGVDAAKRIMEIDDRARILAITALSKMDIGEECMRAGCGGFLIKPFGLKELVDSVNALSVRSG
jgi:two-component system chemotaxis response regulator CheY